MTAKREALPGVMDGHEVIFALSRETLQERLGTDFEKGLSDAQVSSAREQYGANELNEAPPVPVWRRFVAQFNDLVIWVLIAAALVSGAMGEWADALAIFAIVLGVKALRPTPEPALEQRRSWARVGIGLAAVHVVLVVTIVLLNLDRLSKLIDALRAMSDLR